MTQGAETCCKLQKKSYTLNRSFCLKVSLTGWYFGVCLACHPTKRETLSAKSSAVRPSSAGDRRLHIIVLARYPASLIPPAWHNSSTPEVLISNSVCPAHLNRMEFCILASGEQHRIVRAAVRPTGRHIWTMVWSNHARLVNYVLSSKLILRPPREMNRERCNCQLRLEATSYTWCVKGLLSHPV